MARAGVTGFNELVRRINTMSADFQQEVKDIIAINTSDMEMEAIRNAPGPGDFIGTEHGPENERDIVNSRGWTPISQAIGYSIHESGYKGIVFVESTAGAIAAWVEFGTGQSARTYLATVPAEWKALAQKYYINGKGTIIANPYLLPAWTKYQIKTVKELKAAMKNLRL